MSSTGKPPAAEAAPDRQVEFWFLGLRVGGKGERMMAFRVVDPDTLSDRDDTEILFDCDAGRTQGATIGHAYSLTHKGGVTWAIPAKHQWHKALVWRGQGDDAEPREARRDDIAIWQAADMAARQGLQAQRHDKNDALERAVKPLASIYWGLSASDRPAFEAWVLRRLRKLGER